MANLLSKEVSTTHLTPVFSVPAINESSLQGNTLRSIPKIYVSTARTIRKEGTNLFIDNNKIDLNNKSVYDLIKILDDYSIENLAVNNEDYCNYPASCLLDFSNKEVHEVPVTCVPFNIKFLNRLKTNTLIQLETCSFEVLRVTDNYKNSHIYNLRENYLYLKDYVYHCKLLYSVKCEKFIIKLSNKFSTNSKEVLGRYLNGVE